MTKASFVVLTQGDRPEELDRAIESIIAQDFIEAEIVLVSNGAGQLEVPDVVRLVVSRENLGIPGGRNLGQGECLGAGVVEKRVSDVDGRVRPQGLLIDG